MTDPTTREPTDIEIRVANAILNALGAEEYEIVMDATRAAIRAMLKPSIEMINMGGRNIGFKIQHFGGALTLARYSSPQIEADNQNSAAAAWEAMINAASPEET